MGLAAHFGQYIPAIGEWLMKILYLHQHFSTRSGHAGTRSYEFAKYLVSQGETVEMVCGRNAKSNFDIPEEGLIQNWNIEGIDVTVINVGYGNHMGFIARVLAFLKFAIFSTYVGLRQKDIDVVFATSTPLTVAIPGLIVSFFKRKPLVFEVRDIWPESAVGSGALKNKFVIKLLEWFERLVYRRSQRIIALSHRMKDRMVRNSAIPPEKVDVIPIGSDYALFSGEKDWRWREENGLSDKFLAIFPGAHGVANGLDVLVDCAKLLPDNIRIVMMGQGGQKERLMKRAEDEGVDKILFFPPLAKEQLASILPTMDCGLQILKPIEVFETALPNKFFDFCAAGLPVIVNLPCEVADIVVEKNAGKYVEVNTAENVAQAIIDLQKDADIAEIKANAKSIAERFERGKMAKEFHAVLKGL